jgi:hypothetical protein
VRESLALEVLYLFLCAFILFMLARNVLLCTFMFIDPTWVLAVQLKCSRSEGPVGASLAVYKAFC